MLIVQARTIAPDRRGAPVGEIHAQRAERRAEVLDHRDRRRAPATALAPSGGQISRWLGALLSQCARNTAISRNASTSARLAPPRAASIRPSSYQLHPWSSNPSTTVPVHPPFDDRRSKVRTGLSSERPAKTEDSRSRAVRCTSATGTEGGTSVALYGSNGEHVVCTESERAQQPGSGDFGLQLGILLAVLDLEDSAVRQLTVKLRRALRSASGR